MHESPKIEELMLDVELLKNVVSVLIAFGDSSTEGAVSERLLRLFPDGSEAKERLTNLN